MYIEYSLTNILLNFMLNLRVSKMRNWNALKFNISPRLTSDQGVRCSCQDAARTRLLTAPFLSDPCWWANIFMQKYFACHSHLPVCCCSPGSVYLPQTFACITSQRSGRTDGRTSKQSKKWPKGCDVVVVGGRGKSRKTRGSKSHAHNQTRRKRQRRQQEAHTKL